MWLPRWLDKLIADNYGSNRGLLKYVYYQLCYRVGCFKKHDLTKLNLKPKRYVFVCAGNICRSALSDIVAKNAGVYAVSFGLDTRGGDPADPRAISFAKSLGLDLTKHKTKSITHYTAEEGDLVIGMEPKHLHMFRSIDQTTPFVLLGLSSKKPIAFIHDPYNTNPVFFEKCERLVHELTLRVISHHGSR